MARTRGVRALVVLTVALGTAGAGLPLRAQPSESERANAHPEVRVDAIISEHRSSIQLGAGVQIPAGYYARIAIGAGAGTSRVAEGAQGRVDVLGRFLFDPFRQSPVGFSAGAGVSVMARPGEQVRPFLLAVLDFEGRRTSGGMSPAIQIGLGGGLRVGGVLRWGAARAR